MDAFISLPLVGVDSKPSSSTVVKNAKYVETIRSLTASEALQYPTGNAVVDIKKMVALQEEVHHYFTSLSVSAVQSALNSAIAGVVTNGQGTLVAGVLAVTVPGLTTSNKGFSQLVIQAGTSTTVYEYKAVCTANTLTITAVTVAGATVTTDTSVVNYFAL